MTNYTINTPTISIPSDIYGLLGVGTDNTGKLITPESLVTGYVTPSSVSTFTNKSGNISQWTNDVGYLTTETFTGTVTSVGATVPIGLSVSGSPITSSGTLDITFTAGYAIPTTASQTNWDTAYGWGDHAAAGYQIEADIPSVVAEGRKNYYRLPTYARTLDLTSTDADLKGFIGGFTDGRYGYFVPYNNGAAFGKVARVDFTDFSTVSVLDLTLTDANLRGFIGGFTDGRYGYFVPYSSLSKVARVDLF